MQKTMVASELGSTVQFMVFITIMNLTNQLLNYNRYYKDGC